MQTKGFFQKTIALFLILLVPAFIIANFALLKSRRNYACDLQKESCFEQDMTDKSFVFIVYSPGVPKNCEQCLSSIFEQKYERYRILVIETETLKPFVENIKSLGAKANKSHLLTILSTEEETLTINNFRKAIDSCSNQEIVIQLEASDWLAHDHVLTKINQIYLESSDTWLTFTGYLEYPSYKKGLSKPYLKKMLRNREVDNIPWLSSHFKIYYAGVFKQMINDDRCVFKRKLADNLNLFMLPMAQNAKNHIRFIDDPLFVHNTSTPGSIF